MRSGPTVFGGDEELGLGPYSRGDRDWQVDRPVRGADRAATALGELLAGRPDGTRGPCSELYLDRGERYGSAAEVSRRRHRPTSSSGTTSSSIFDLGADGSLSELPLRARHRPRGRANGHVAPGCRLGLRGRRRARSSTSPRRCRAAATARTMTMRAMGGSPMMRGDGDLPARRRGDPPTRIAATSCAGSCGGRSSRAVSASSLPGCTASPSARSRPSVTSTSWSTGGTRSSKSGPRRGESFGRTPCAAPSCSSG